MHAWPIELHNTTMWTTSKKKGLSLREVEEGQQTQYLPNHPHTLQKILEGYCVHSSDMLFLEKRIQKTESSLEK